MLKSIKINADNLIEVDKLRLSADSSYVNDATVAWTLEDSEGESVSYGSLAYVASSDGKYQGTIDDSVLASLTDGATYYLTITATQSTKTGRWRIPLIAKYDEGCDG